MSGDRGNGNRFCMLCIILRGLFAGKHTRLVIKADGIHFIALILLYDLRHYVTGSIGCLLAYHVCILSLLPLCDTLSVMGS